MWYGTTPDLGSVLDNDTDPDRDTLTAQAGTISTNRGGSVEMNADGTFSYTVAPGEVSHRFTDSFSYTVNDGHGHTASGLVILTADGNFPPVAVDDTMTITYYNPNGYSGFNVLTNDSDPDGDQIRAGSQSYVQIAGLGMFFLDSDGKVSLTLSNAQVEGTFTVEYMIFDEYDDSDTGTLTIVVDYEDPVKNLTTDNYHLAYGYDRLEGTVSVLANDGFAEGEDPQAFITINPEHGNFWFQPNGTFVYAQSGDYYGADSFEYVVRYQTATGEFRVSNSVRVEITRTDIAQKARDHIDLWYDTTYTELNENYDSAVAGIQRLMAFDSGATPPAGQGPATTLVLHASAFIIRKYIASNPVVGGVATAVETMFNWYVDGLRTDFGSWFAAIGKVKQVNLVDIHEEKQWLQEQLNEKVSQLPAGTTNFNSIRTYYESEIKKYDTVYSPPPQPKDVYKALLIKYASEKNFDYYWHPGLNAYYTDEADEPGFIDVTELVKALNNL